MRNFYLLFSLFFLSTAATAQPNVSFETYATGLSSPIGITNVGDERLFVNERSGRIKIIDGDGNVMSTPFLDIDARVIPTGGFSEQGLLGVAFHPDYLNNGYFYVHYTRNNGDGRISRFAVTADPNVADPDSEFPILTLDQPFQNHNGGDLAFGPDGYLYIGTGDGGSGGDPGNRAQNTSLLLGKMLRIDVDNGTPYSVPADNPFVDDTAVLDEIWSIGLRNPWQFSFDQLTGDLWIGDVGQNAVEEIDFEAAGSSGGLNYGWRCFEANSSYNSGGCQPASAYTAPLFAYDQGGFGGPCSITGGHVYRGCEFSDIAGGYFYGDFCNGEMWVLFREANGTLNNVSLGTLNGVGIAAFGEDGNGRLFLADMTGGEILRITTDAETVPPTLDYDGTTMTIEDGDFAPYTDIQWFLDGNLVAGENASTYEPLTDGEVFAMMTSTQGCSFTTDVASIFVSTKTITGLKQFDLFPNPTSDFINIDFQLVESGLVNINLLSVDGKQVANIFEGKTQEVKREYSVKGLAPGVYFVEVKVGEEVMTKRVVRR